ncbi:MAG TPA: kelch repeat-containing protein, partial [Gemmatimonadales bacterium]|nr:kelch repeat-containing protein [Gemmatimonadales bacterium]
MNPSRIRRILAVVAVALLVGCERPVTPSAGTGTLSFQVVSGDQQTGAAGSQLAAPLVVKVLKPDGGPQKDQVLNFRVIAGGGSVFGGTEITDNSGTAQELWTLGQKAGEPQKIEVRAVDPQTGEPQVFATFTATAIAGPPVRMTKLAGDGQQVEPGETVPIPPSVKLEDQFGNPVANAGVAFTVSRGSVTGGNATTDANGVATVGSWTTGKQVTTDTLVARVNATGVSGNPARFFAVVRFCDCWSVKATLLEAVTSAAAGTINGKLYVFGGQRSNGTTSSSLEQYDPATNTWTFKASGFGYRQAMGVAVL